MSINMIRVYIVTEVAPKRDFFIDFKETFGFHFIVARYATILSTAVGRIQQIIDILYDL